MVKKDNITIGQLAQMVQKWFDDIEKRVATKEQLEKMESKFESKFDKIDGRLSRIEENNKYFRERLRVVENTLGIE